MLGSMACIAPTLFLTLDPFPTLDPFLTLDQFLTLDLFLTRTQADRYDKTAYPNRNPNCSRNPNPNPNLAT